jgi:hypothetical protein
MASLRPYLLVCMCAPLIACSSSGSPTPTGMHYHYVANQVNVPTSNAQANEYGLDLTNSGMVQNQLGMVLGTLANMGFDIQGDVNKAVAEGSLMLLLDVQTTSFTSTSAAGISAFLGATSTPAACNGSADTYVCTGSGASETCTGCAHQFGGSASFTINSSAPTNPALAGPIVNGTMTGGSEASTLSLQIALAGTTPIQLNLIGARVKATDLSATGLGTTTGTQPNQASSGGVIFGGAITMTELDGTVIPAITTQLNSIITTDCTPPAAPPGCGCASGSTAATILGLFLPTGATSCTLTATDIENNSLIVSLLAPDVTINGMPALSLGINATAVGADFTPASE